MRRSGLRRPPIVAAIAVMLAAVPAVIVPFGSTVVGAAPAPIAAASKHGKLSPRLATLASGAGFGAPRAQARALSLPSSGAGSLVRRPDGRVLVEVRVSSTAPATVAELERLGAHVVNVSSGYATVTAAVAPSALQAISTDSHVRYVSEVIAPQVGRAGATPGAGTSATAAACSPIVSEGDTLMNVAAARANNAIDASGQTIGLLSDSFNSYGDAANDVAHGELPGVGNPCGHTAPVKVQADDPFGSDEGRAMAQLAHDLAPGAHLAFATADNGELDFAAQISKLRTVNHASVLADDVTYFDEPFFQNGPVANAVNAASAAGVPYFSAAGNSNLIVGGKNVSSYETPAFRPVSCPPHVAAAEPALSGCHDYDTTGGIDRGDGITVAPGGGFLLDMQWAEPWGAVTDDYDVFVLNPAGNVVASSVNDNSASQRPFEILSYFNQSNSAQTVNIVIGKYSGPTNARMKFIILGSGGITAVQYNSTTGGDVVGPSIFGHNGAATVGSTAAIPYNNSNKSEPYSSRGPVTLYYQPTPGTAPLGAPQVLNQPAFAATDGVRTSFFGQFVQGVWRFFGTSAAAPQAAAIGALLREKDAALTPAQVISTLSSTARPVATNGTPDAVGGGYLDADAALASVPSLPGAPKIFSVVSGDGQATMQWTAAASNPNFPVTGYVVTPRLGGVDQPGQPFGPNPTGGVITSLTNGGTYTFTVAAVNANGTGPSSVPSAPLTVGSPVAPAAPTSTPTNGGATVTWNAPADNGSPITQYTLLPYRAGAPQPVIIVSAPATTHTLSGLTNGTSYTFVVAATNARGTGRPSPAGAATIVGSPLAPTSPTVVPRDTGATVHWTAPPDNGSAITRYVITAYRAGVQYSHQAYDSPATTQTIGGLLNGTTYTFTIKARNSSGAGPESSATPPILVGAPGAPTGVTATGGHQSAVVHWSAPPSNGSAVTAYTVTPYLGAVAGTARAFHSAATTQTVSGLTTGQHYTFRVSATNARGAGPQSAASNVATIT